MFLILPEAVLVEFPIAEPAEKDLVVVRLLEVDGDILEAGELNRVPLRGADDAVDARVLAGTEASLVTVPVLDHHLPAVRAETAALTGVGHPGLSLGSVIKHLQVHHHLVCCCCFC